MEKSAYDFKEVNGIIVCINNKNGIILSTPQKKGAIMVNLFSISSKTKEEVKSYKLKKLWPHRTRFEHQNILNGKSIETILKEELEKRNYKLLNGKWIKNLITETEASGTGY